MASAWPSVLAAEELLQHVGHGADLRQNGGKGICLRIPA
jgi:hypothetical protein